MRKTLRSNPWPVGTPRPAPEGGGVGLIARTGSLTSPGRLRGQVRRSGGRRRESLTTGPGPGTVHSGAAPPPRGKGDDDGRSRPWNTPHWVIAFGDALRRRPA